MSAEVTRILHAIQNGQQQAAEELLPLVYGELRRLAGIRMRQERPGQTLQPTALVHEAFLRLVGGEDWQKWDGRAHFFAAAAEAMRRILIEQARQRATARRGGRQKRVELDEISLTGDPDEAGTLLDLDDALQKLAATDPDLVRVVELRFFSGLSVEETAAVLGVSERTVKRHWAYARAWLQREMEGAP